MSQLAHFDIFHDKYDRLHVRNTVLDYKKGSNSENIFSAFESIDHQLSNALSIKFISHLEPKIDTIEKRWITIAREVPLKKKNAHMLTINDPQTHSNSLIYEDPLAGF